MRFLEVDMRVTIAVSESIADSYHVQDIKHGLVASVEGETVFSVRRSGEREELTAVAEDAVVQDVSWRP